VDYKSAGVDIDAGARAVDLMREAVRSTYTGAVLAGIGSFGGLFDATSLKSLNAPVLVASTDGVGTKTRVAMSLGKPEGLGRDIVNHCVNDILVQGARPLFFLDYVAMSRLDPEAVAAVVTGAAAACREAGCALLGGETAEMPGVYAAGELDIVGTVVGLVERERIIDGRAVRPGDKVIGLASSGLHTNGFSLARKALEGVDLGAPFDGSSLGDRLIEPHRSYLPAFAALEAAGIRPRAMAHITGGGLVENPPRVLPDGTGIVLREGSWPVPAVFEEILRRGAIERREAHRAFNMGLGMLVIVSSDEAEEALRASAEPSGGAWLVGEVIEGEGVTFA
jgi:phosphoribosylformylglycinamidine cyclo-ligase